MEYTKSRLAIGYTIKDGDGLDGQRGRWKYTICTGTGPTMHGADG